MYSLDINFLKDRGLDSTTEVEGAAPKKASSPVEYIPAGIGAIAMIVFPLLSWNYAQSFEAKQAEAEAKIQEIDGEIAKRQGENKSLEEMEQEVNKAKAETAALVSVFDKIRPWSAILQEVRDRTPPGIQVESLTQNGSGSSPKIEINGVARSYEDVNDFVLFLKRSPFFDSNQIILGSVDKSSLGIDIANEEDLPDNVSVSIPDGVQYRITAQLINKPTSALMKEIQNKGSVGVVTRLKTLEQKGAITK